MLLLFSQRGISSSNQVPHFSDYPSNGVFDGKPAKVILKTPDEKNYRTRLRDASVEKIDFAGEYVLTYWGCGCCCRSLAAISKKTGKVAFLKDPIIQPFADINEDILQYRLDSKMLVVIGQLGEKDDSHGFGRHYFIMTDKGFKKIHFTQLPTLSSEEVGKRIRKGLDDAHKQMSNK